MSDASPGSVARLRAYAVWSSQRQTARTSGAHGGLCDAYRILVSLGRGIRVPSASRAGV
jgi:hypothetical protein